MGKFKSVAAGLYMGIAAIAFTATPVAAIPISADLFVANDGLLTRNAGLDWLDVDITVGLSFSAVNMATTTFAILGGLNPITDLGFRHATISEVETLLTNAGIAPINDSLFREVNFAPIEALKLLLGPTVRIGTNTEGTQGITLDGPSVGRHFRASFTRCLSACAPGPSGRSRNFPSTGSLSDIDAKAGEGHFLVRATQAIPEPGTLALFGLGLVGLGVTRRRKAA